jgi:hypothetical protein
MATELLSTASTAANSSEVTVTAGAPVTVAMKGATAGALINVQIKDETGAFHVIDKLTIERPALVISGPGVYRLARVAGGSCGAFNA